MGQADAPGDSSHEYVTTEGMIIFIFKAVRYVLNRNSLLDSWVDAHSSSSFDHRLSYIVFLSFLFTPSRVFTNDFIV